MMKLTNLKRIIHEEVVAALSEISPEVIARSVEKTTKMTKRSAQKDRFIRALKDKVLPDNIKFQIKTKDMIQDFYFEELYYQIGKWYIVVGVRPRTAGSNSMTIEYDVHMDKLSLNGNQPIDDSDMYISRNGAIAIIRFIKLINKNTKLTPNSFNLLDRAME